MRILYGITKSNFGGAQRYVFDLATETLKKKYEVVVLCGQSGILVDKLKKEKIKVIEIDSLNKNISLFNDIKSFFEIYKILKQERPDVFHINSSKMGGIGAVAGRLAGVRKIIFTAHNWAFNWPRPAWQRSVIKFFQWLTILFSHRTICVSEKTKKEVEGWPFVKNRLIVIYNGVKEFDLMPRQDKAFTVGVISELHKVKGLDILLTAWSKFVKNHRAKLLIIGEGEERTNLENMARNLGISESVTFKGFVDNVRSLLPSFDIFCMPSRSEGMPYALLEAGLAGLPVIATSVGGIPEIIESGVTGVLVPVENAEVLFSTLVLLAEDGELRKRLGTNLKSSIKENFLFEKMVKNTLNIYL